MSSDYLLFSHIMLRLGIPWCTYGLESNLNLGCVCDGLGWNLFVLCRIYRSLPVLRSNNDQCIFVYTLALQFVHDLAKRAVHEVNGF